MTPPTRACGCTPRSGRSMRPTSLRLRSACFARAASLASTRSQPREGCFTHPRLRVLRVTRRLFAALSGSGNRVVQVVTRSITWDLRMPGRARRCASCSSARRAMLGGCRMRRATARRCRRSRTES